MKRLCWMMLAAALTAGMAWGQEIQGVVITPEGKRLSGAIKWKPSSKAYAFKQTGVNAEIELPLDKVADLEIPKPANFDGAVAKVVGGNAAAAISDLKGIITAYNHLKWDETATRYLAEAYLKSGNAKEAKDVCEKVVSQNAEAAYKGDVAPVYWDALIACDRAAKAEELMTKAIRTGDRPASAFAAICRGDLVLKESQTPDAQKKALRDGYLRVVALYQDVPEARAKAAEKAAKCFEKLGQSGRAQTMRQLAAGK